MPKRISFLFSILLFLTIKTWAAKPEVVIFKDKSSNAQSITTQVKKYLAKRVSISQRGIATESAVQKLSNNPPAAVIVLDNTSARSFKRVGTKGIPLIVATDAKNYASLKGLGATFADKFRVDSTLSMALTESQAKNITFLYIAKNRSAISRTATQCRARGITVSHIPIKDETPEEIKKSITSISDKETLLYIVWNKSLYETLTLNPDLTTHISAKTKAIISTSSSIINHFKKKAHTFIIQRDIPTLAALISEATAKAVNSNYSNPSRSLLIESAALVRYMKHTGKTIILLSQEGQKRHNRAISAVTSIKTLPEPPKNTITPDTAVSKVAIVDTIKSKEAGFDTSWAIEDSTKKAIALNTKKSKPLPKTTKTLNKSPKTSVKVDTTYITVTEDITNIFSSISPALTLVGVARKGDTFPLLKEEGEYLCIDAWGKQGYILSSSIAIKEEALPENEAVASRKDEIKLFLKNNFVVVSIGSSLLLILFVSLIISLIQKGRARRKLIYLRSALILSKKPKRIVVSDKTGATTTLEKFLRKLEIQLSPVTTISYFQKRMIEHMPDLLIVDWNMDHKIADIIKEQLSKYRLSSATTLIFYHVPDKDRLKLSSGFGQSTVYLHDEIPSVEKIELILGEEKETTLANTEKINSHLSGVLGNSHLEDIIQLLGSSQKSGCLVVEDEDPFAVIFFERGIIVDAMTKDGTVNREAIFECLRLTEGNFYFMLNRESAEQTMYLQTMQLLLEWSQHQDSQLETTELPNDMLPVME